MSLLLRRHYIQEEQVNQYSDLENKNLEELKDLAKEAGVAGAYKLTKAEIVEVLEELKSEI
ncbi:TPA: Rho termination factor N-terminal domain-containing protein [Streptococcus pneumoniae]|nr:transcription termination factor [Streptococcus pneumoniae]VIT66033.1 transcription termination factor [Streptococcus pneumoniae]VKX06346.1 transcription termination factor [Streptococcus pneumoniae]VQU69330.1 transcription termination factor [Streptococcus pneumoniae]HEU6622056.1 Rho termination factor N-terminal domain-containing protein [Streptococcus pneumoniae]